MFYIDTVDFCRKKYERNGLLTIADRNGILWLNRKHVEEGLDHKNLRVTTVKYLSDYRNFYTQTTSSQSNHRLYNNNRT